MREEVEDVLEWIGGPAATGARIRIGGLAGDVPPGFGRRLRDFLAELGVFLDDFEGAVTRGASVQKRLEGRGRIAAETAVSLGLSGPCLRASGIPRDVRRTSPYAGYERLELDVLTREEGDAWARLLMRLAEIRQSLRILGQALDDLPPGPVLLESVGLPPKARLGSELEAMVRHFELLMPGGGPRAPLGREVHRSTETASGELGFYALSAGGPRPHRLRVRSPSFRAAAALSRMLVGERLEDVATVVSSLGIVASEVDR
jgi:NADH-quinone oxidoreductase subunit D